MVKNRMEGKEKDMKCYDWFFYTKPIEKEEVFNKVLMKN